MIKILASTQATTPTTTITTPTTSTLSTATIPSSTTTLTTSTKPITSSSSTQSRILIFVKVMRLKIKYSLILSHDSHLLYENVKISKKYSIDFNDFSIKYGQICIIQNII